MSKLEEVMSDNKQEQNNTNHSSVEEGRWLASFTVADESIGTRLDAFVASQTEDYSRAQIQAWIKQADILVDDKQVKPNLKLRQGQLVTVSAELPEQVSYEPEAMDLDILYEDDSLLVINKPYGLVVHPGAGNTSGTLLNGLMHHDAALVHLPRCGIVHRLDKDTSGLMVIAKTSKAYQSLIKQLKKKSVYREYVALVNGEMISGGTVEAAIDRHPTARTKMAVVPDSLSKGKEAVTHYRVIEKFYAYTLVRCMLETGRTHQIRVHMAHIDYDLVGDRVYGGSLKLPKGISQQLKAALQQFNRQALHAKLLGFVHPETQEQLEFEAPIPKDLTSLIELIRQETCNHQN